MENTNFVSMEKYNELQKKYEGLKMFIYSEDMSGDLFDYYDLMDKITTENGYEKCETIQKLREEFMIEMASDGGLTFLLNNRTLCRKWREHKGICLDKLVRYSKFPLEVLVAFENGEDVMFEEAIHAAYYHFFEALEEKECLEIDGDDDQNHGEEGEGFGDTAKINPIIPPSTPGLIEKLKDIKIDEDLLNKIKSGDMLKNHLPKISTPKFPDIKK